MSEVAGFYSSLPFIHQMSMGHLALFSLESEMRHRIETESAGGFVAVVTLFGAWRAQNLQSFSLAGRTNNSFFPLMAMGKKKKKKKKETCSFT